MKIFVIINSSWYMLPDSAVMHSGNPLFVPDFDSDFRIFPGVAYRIGKLGKNIAPRFAYRYLEGAAPCGVVVACNLLKQLREAGLPWTEAVSFDRSCILGNFMPIDSFINCGPVKWEAADCSVMCNPQQAEMPIEEILAAVSKANTIKTGDIIITAIAPKGIRAVPNTRLTAFSNSLNQILIDLNIK